MGATGERLEYDTKPPFGAPGLIFTRDYLLKYLVLSVGVPFPLWELPERGSSMTPNRLLGLQDCFYSRLSPEVSCFVRRGSLPPMGATGERLEYDIKPPFGAPGLSSFFHSKLVIQSLINYFFSH